MSFVDYEQVTASWEYNNIFPIYTIFLASSNYSNFAIVLAFVI